MILHTIMTTQLCYAVATREIQLFQPSPTSVLNNFIA